MTGWAGGGGGGGRSNTRVVRLGAPTFRTLACWGHIGGQECLSPKP